MDAFKIARENEFYDHASIDHFEQAMRFLLQILHGIHVITYIYIWRREMNQNKEAKKEIYKNKWKSSIHMIIDRPIHQTPHRS